MKPLSQIKAFFEKAAERKLTGSDQLMYLHLFNAFNEAYWSETVRISDAELKERMRLYDVDGKPISDSTIQRARKRLKEKGFIEIVRGKNNEPAYRLPRLYPATPPATPPADPAPNSYIPAREDVKTLDVKTKKEGARERELSEIWLDEMHRPLGASERYELAELEELHGYEKVKNAIIATRQSRAYPTFTDLKNILKGVNNGKSKQPIERSHEESANVPWEV